MQSEAVILGQLQLEQLQLDEAAVRVTAVNSEHLEVSSL